MKTQEAVVPEPLVTCDPVPHLAELSGDEMVAAFATVPLLGQETGIEQDAKVLGDRRAAHFEMGRNLADRKLGFGEQIQHLAPRTMADRHEHIGLAIWGYDHAPNIGKQFLTSQVQVFPPSGSNAMAVEPKVTPQERPGR